MDASPAEPNHGAALAFTYTWYWAQTCPHWTGVMHKAYRYAQNYVYALCNHFPTNMTTGCASSNIRCNPIGGPTCLQEKQAHVCHNVLQPPTADPLTRKTTQ